VSSSPPSSQPPFLHGISWLVSEGPYEFRLLEVLGRVETLHGYVVDKTWDGGVRGNKGSEGVKGIVKFINRNRGKGGGEGGREGQEKMWELVEELLDTCKLDVDVTLNGEVVRGVFEGLVNQMVKDDKQR